MTIHIDTLVKVWVLDDGQHERGSGLAMRICDTLSCTVLADSPGFITAWVLPDRETVHVYRSVIVQDSDPLYRPVAEYLDGKAYTVTEDTIVDVSMVFGAGTLTTYMLT